MGGMSGLPSLPLTALLDRVAAAEPTPGGGAVAAIAGAFGAALVQMVAGLPRTRHDTNEERAVLATLAAPLADLRARLLALADEDTAAFDHLMAAFRRPKASDEEKAARREAIQAATREATTVPLQTAVVAARVLDLAGTVAALGNPSASSDLLVGMGMLRAAAEGAAANVRINLEGIKDDAFRADAAARIAAVLDEVATHGHAVTAALQG
jgi:formiminotetrahydrofolate cyclodeaminase